MENASIPSLVSFIVASVSLYSIWWFANWSINYATAPINSFTELLWRPVGFILPAAAFGFWMKLLQTIIAKEAA